MRMYMVSVAVSRDQNLVTSPRLFRELQRNFVRLFGSNLLSRRKRLCVVIEENAVSFIVNSLRRHEFTEGILAVAVDTADQSALGFAVKGLILLPTVIDNRPHCEAILCALRDKHDRCHQLSSPFKSRIAS